MFAQILQLMKLCKLFGILDPCYIVLTDVENFFMDKLNLVILLLPGPVLDFYHFESRMNNSTEEFIQNDQEFSTRSGKNEVSIERVLSIFLYTQSQEI